MSDRRAVSDSAFLLNISLHFLDWLAVFAAAFLAHGFYLDAWVLKPGYDLAILLALVLSSWMFSINSLYDRQRGLLFFVEVRQLAIAWSGVFLVLALLATLTKSGAEYSRGWGTIWFVIGFGLLVLFRFLLRGVLKSLRSRGRNVRRIVVVGTETSIPQVVSTLSRHAWLGYEVRGVLIEGFLSDPSGIQVLGKPMDVLKIVNSEPVSEVWIALPLSREDQVRALLDILRDSTVDVRYIPDLLGLKLINHSITSVAGMSVLNLSTSPMTGMNRLVKAVEDRLIALTALFLLSPLMFLIAIFIKVSSPGPVLYRQERVGWNGQSFTMYKFRSMTVDAESDGVNWGGSKEMSITSVGAILRKTSLDELPQFVNVLRGDMSVVGPRPERTEYVEKFRENIPGYMKKHIVKAGITGWAQVNGWRGDTDLVKRIEYDLYYIDNWSIWFDLKIILLTVFRGMVSENAY